MNRENKNFFEILAELTGESPEEVESVINQSLQKFEENKELVVISESFPCIQFLAETL